VVQKREQWEEDLKSLDKDKVVFLDESGVNTDLTRKYGRCAGGNRCIDHAPVTTPKNTTILSSICLDGKTAYTTYQGGTTKERFIEYLKKVLAPTLEKDSIVVMDNMRTHHAKDVVKAIKKLNIKVIYLPPYSPDFNPIEKMWSKIKAILRKWKPRTPNALDTAVKFAFSCVSPRDSCGWFASCGIA